MRSLTLVSMRSKIRDYKDLPAASVFNVSQNPGRCFGGKHADKRHAPFQSVNSWLLKSNWVILLPLAPHHQSFLYLKRSLFVLYWTRPPIKPCWTEKYLVACRLTDARGAGDDRCPSSKPPDNQHPTQAQRAACVIDATSPMERVNTE